jgi:hypothetical protein
VQSEHGKVLVAFKYRCLKKIAVNLIFLCTVNVPACCGSVPRVHFEYVIYRAPTLNFLIIAKAKRTFRTRKLQEVCN